MSAFQIQFDLIIIHLSLTFRINVPSQTSVQGCNCKSMYQSLCCMYCAGDIQGLVGRRNANNKDLNRNFPDMYAARTDAIQPETEVVMAWSKSHPFVLSANLHGGE